MSEIRKGIEKVHDTTRRAALEAFFQQLAQRFAGRILPLDEAVAERWGPVDQSVRSAQHPPARDRLAPRPTALEYDLTLVTHNVRDFCNMPITVLNPTL